MNQRTSIIDVSEDRLCGLIASAKKRLIVVAPAATVRVAQAIKERWITLGALNVSITIDVDPEVYRLGYSDRVDALGILKEAAAATHSVLNREPGVRLGLVIVDDATLVYAPVPLLIEAGPRSPSAPNGILLGIPTPGLLDALGMGERGALSQEIGLSHASQADIESVEKELENNPPRAFDIARAERVFSAVFQFVELEMVGTQLGRRTVQIPTELLGVVDEKVRSELRTVLNFLPPDNTLSGNHLQAMRRQLDKEYLNHIPGEGSVVLRENRDAFLESVKLLEGEVERFKESVRERLEKEIETRIAELEQLLLPRLLKRPPAGWLLPSTHKRDDTIKKYLRQDLERSFGKIREWVDDMAVRQRIKNITIDMLRDERFMDAARTAFPDIAQLFEEYDSAPAVTKFDPNERS